jgi:hypothetical protein
MAATLDHIRAGSLVRVCGEPSECRSGMSAKDQTGATAGKVGAMSRVWQSCATRFLYAYAPSELEHQGRAAIRRPRPAVCTRFDQAASVIHLDRVRLAGASVGRGPVAVGATDASGDLTLDDPGSMAGRQLRLASTDLQPVCRPGHEPSVARRRRQLGTSRSASDLRESRGA